MDQKQEKAIRQMNKALKALKEADIHICGMDNDLFYATGKALKNYSSKHESGGVYCPVAQANVRGDEGTGKFEADCYQDSGGW